MISCMKEAKEYNAVLTEDTISLKGVLILWIFGSPYALGRIESLDRNFKNCCLEM